MQLTINRVAGENINRVAGEEVEKCERLQEKNSAFSIERCGMWCANEIFLGFKVGNRNNLGPKLGEKRYL